MQMLKLNNSAILDDDMYSKKIIAKNIYFIFEIIKLFSHRSSLQVRNFKLPLAYQFATERKQFPCFDRAVTEKMQTQNYHCNALEKI